MQMIHLSQRGSAFRRDQQGAVSIVFGLALVACLLSVGAAVDYTRASTTRSRLQEALDSAVLAAAIQPAARRDAAATATFNANVQGTQLAGVSVSFQQGASTYSGTASISVATSFMALAAIDSLTVGAVSEAYYATTAGVGACIVTLGHGQTVSDSSFTLNGAPNMALTNCSVISNTSMRCNGHGGGADKSLAVGSASGCSNPISNAPAWGDPFASLAANITTRCPGLGGGVTWTPGTLPNGPNFIAVGKSGYTEYHICGDLSLSGTGSLVSGGGVIVVENGSINVSGSADVTATNAVFVLTGANSASHFLTFPNGRGHSATLTVQAPTGALNPWHSIAIYVDPALTANVDDSFGPGASLAFDGVAYMPNTNLTFHGNTQSAAGQCSILVVSTFTSNGSGSIAFAQSNGACLDAGVGVPVMARLTR